MATTPTKPQDIPSSRTSTSSLSPTNERLKSSSKRTGFSDDGTLPFTKRDDNQQKIVTVLPELDESPARASLNSDGSSAFFKSSNSASNSPANIPVTKSSSGSSKKDPPSRGSSFNEAQPQEGKRSNPPSLGRASGRSTNKSFLSSSGNKKAASNSNEASPRPSIDSNKESEINAHELPGEGDLSTQAKRGTMITYALQRGTIISYGPILFPTSTEKPDENVNLMYSDREAETLKEIFAFLVNKEPNVLREFFSLKLVPTDELCETLLTMSFVTSTVMKLFRFFMEDEFAANKDDAENLFRENAIATKLFKSYIHAVGKPYLEELLNVIIDQITLTERKTSLEINPSFTDPEELESNKVALIQKINEIVSQITTKLAIDKMPIGIRVIVSYLIELAGKFSENSARSTQLTYMLVGEFIIVRYLNPAILDPRQYNLAQAKQPNSIAKRNLTLITKILQNLASGVPFSKKEQYLAVLNDAIEPKRTILDKYFRQLSVPSSTTVPVATELDVVSVKDLHNIHRFLFQYRDQLAVMVSSQNIGDFGRLLDKLGSYQSKVSFSFLTASERQFVKSLLDERHEEAIFINWVDKKKRNKVQKRLLIVGMNRILSVKPSGKVAREGHSLDLVEIKSPDQKELELVFKNFSIVASTEQSDDIINSIRRAYEYNFFCLPEQVRFKTDVVPRSRLVDVSIGDEYACGGFVGTYRSFCDYHHIPVHSSLPWDIENLYNNTKILDLSKIKEEYDEPLELLPILEALKYNRHFTSLIMKKFKTDKKEVVNALAELLKENVTLTHLTISGLSTFKEGYLTIMEGLFNGVGSNITYFDFSNTPLEDKGLISFANFVKKHNRQFKTINLDNTYGTSKAYSKVISSLQENPYAGKLEALFLTNCRLGMEASTTLNLYLSKAASNLQTLSVSATSCTLKVIMEGLTTGKVPLKVLDISNNRIVKTEDGDAIADFVSKTSTLKEFNLTNTCPPPEIVTGILVSMNADLNMSLDLSNNNLGTAGASAISKIAYKLGSISKLNLSDNDRD
eukprot:TRINITY_DN12224_c0_g1_i1.p1 TRINITY_DN12224_c0_g1~~TRINITY_DN12224_c0_g1_i1.p1  ORF type:complete len:1028 (-),score=318.37 TRINITY_DN12224_c0_g1_i1:107-3190(-)